MIKTKEITFKDLRFKPRNSQGMWDFKVYSCLQAIATFENGYSLSILTPDKTGRHKYCQANEGSYEIAILKNGEVYYGYYDEDRVGEDIDEKYLNQDNFEGVWIDQPKEKIEQLLKVVKNLK